ncbi:MAG: acyloxyacyl hydrolase [Bacteroidetes bacterium]|nr:acyloxyacyl hydrolase [Bacteroidota bacterium]
MKRIITIFFILISYALFCQDTLPGKKLYVNLNAHYGFIIPHHRNMEYLIKSHVPAGELNFILQTNGAKRWEQVYKNPEKGLGLYFADLGNAEQLGQAIGIFPFVNFPLNPDRKFKLYIRASDGIGLITKPYNRIDNHKNNINGSLLNAFINLKLNSVFYPAKNMRMETGIGLSHLSNGAWTMPNLGINIATVNVGISFKKSENKNQQSAIIQAVKPDTLKQKYFFTIIAAAGQNEASAPDGKKYAAYSVYATEWKTVSEKSRFCMGADAFYEMKNLATAERDTLFDTSNKLNNLQLGLRFGYELVVGKFSLPLEMGAYVFSKTTVKGPLYHRIGIRYQATQHFIINYTLKTHWATAENVEFGIGYKF